MDAINWGNNLMRPNGFTTPQVTPQMPVVPQLPILSIVYVENGRQGAIDYPTPPNCPGIPLFDAHSNTLFIKSTDSYGNVAQLLEYEVNVKKSEADKQNEAMALINSRIDRLEEMIQNGRSKPNNDGSTTEPATATNEHSNNSNKRR